MSLVPEVEIFEAKAATLYAQIQGMDRAAAIFVITKELLLVFRDGGMSASDALLTTFSRGKSK